MQKGIGFQSISSVVKKYWWIIALLMVFGGGWGFMSSRTTTSYEAISRIYINKENSNNDGQITIYNSENDRFWQNVGSFSKTSQFEDAMTNKFSDFRTSALTIDNTNGSNIFSFKYSGSDLSRGVQITNYAVKQVSKDLKKYVQEDVTIKVIDKASTRNAEKIIVSNKKSHTLTGAIYGFILGFVVSALHYLIFKNKK